MKAFQFRFEAVLTVRRNKENTAKILYAQSIKNLQNEELTKQALELQLLMCFESRQNLKDYFLNEERILFLRKEIKKQEERIEAAKKIVQQSLDKFLERRKQTQIMEKLKDNDEKKYQKTVKRVEMKQNDSLYTTHFGVKGEE